MVVTQLTSRKILGINQRTYQRLKLSLTLNLRRQLLIAVCDNTILQNQLASQLEMDIAQAMVGGNRAEDAFQHRPTRLAQLTLASEHPDLIEQIIDWHGQQPQGEAPSLQVLGIEQMTRQSLMLQHHFFQSLDNIERLLPRLESSLLIWLPRPWFRAIQQSAPQFWQWHSGVFEFVGDPTPIVTTRTEAAPADQPKQIKFTKTVQLPADYSADILSSGQLYGESSGLATPSTPTDQPGNPSPENSSTNQTHTPSDRDNADRQSVDLWTLLSEDLAKLEQSPTDTPFPNPTTSETASETTSESASETASEPANAPLTELTEFQDLPLNLGVPLGEPLNLLSQSEDPPKEVAAEITAITPIPDQPPSDQEAVAQSPFDRLTTLKRKNAPPEDIAQAYLALGHYYREQIEAGNLSTTLIQSAAEAYEEGLRWLPDQDPAWGTGLNDLGTLYWMQAQQQTSREQLLQGMHHSLEIYKQGLAKVNQKLQPEIASRLHSNLGAVYSTLTGYENAIENLQQSVNSYRQALPFCSPDQQPEEYATLQNSLGSVYWKLSHYDQPKSCLHRAIAAYNESLRCRHPEKAPLDYAAVQNNLGIAYWSLAKHERPIFLLKHAVAAYRDALNYRTPNTDPGACASTYNNLGTAYWELATQVDEVADPHNRYQQNAAIAYEAALKAAEQGRSNLDLKSIHHCLGNVYEQLAQKETQANGIERQMQRSLKHHLAAIHQLSKTSPNYEPIFGSLVRNVRNHYELLGVTGQQSALSQLPAHLLPEVMQSL